MADIKKDANEKIKKAEEKDILKNNNAELNDDDMDKVAGGAVGQDRTNILDWKMEKL